MNCCRRLIEILKDAPWSVFDLLSGCVLFWIGAYLLISPALFESLQIYSVFQRFTDEWEWGVSFLGCGSISIMIAIWSKKPAFELRLLSRSCVSAHFIMIAINDLSIRPPIVSGMAFTVMSVFALWSVLRTRRVG